MIPFKPNARAAPRGEGTVVAEREDVVVADLPDRGLLGDGLGVLGVGIVARRRVERDHRPALGGVVVDVVDDLVDCPGRKPPVWLLSALRAHTKSAIQNRFAMANAKAA